MQAMLQNTDLGNISPDGLSHSDKFINHDTVQLEKQEQSVQFICIFRNDQKNGKITKEIFDIYKKLCDGIINVSEV